jgi:hypothetical protein
MAGNQAPPLDFAQYVSAKIIDRTGNSYNFQILKIRSGSGMLYALDSDIFQTPNPERDMCRSFDPLQCILPGKESCRATENGDLRDRRKKALHRAKGSENVAHLRSTGGKMKKTATKTYQ